MDGARPALYDPERVGSVASGQDTVATPHEDVTSQRSNPLGVLHDKNGLGSGRQVAAFVAPGRHLDDAVGAWKKDPEGRAMADRALDLDTSARLLDDRELMTICSI